MKFLVILLCILSFSTSSSLPDWVPSDCEDDGGVDGGHQYFFSDIKLSWFDASDECNLYGGYLLRIDSLEEQNCLLKYGQSANLNSAWFWQDGT